MIGLQGFYAPHPFRESMKVPKDPLMGFTFLFRGRPNTKPLPWTFWFSKKSDVGSHKTRRQLAAPPLRFLPLQRLPRTEQRRKIGRACISRPPAPSGFLNLLTPSSAPSLPALFHAGSALGITLQSFLPPVQPYAVPSAFPLLTFQTPSGFCSAREFATRFSGLD